MSAARLQVFLNKRGQLHTQVMPLAMRNLAIAQHRDKERYRLVRGGGWDHPKATFKPGDYVLLRQVPEDTLDVPTRPHILRVVEIKPSGVAVLEGSGVQVDRLGRLAEVRVSVLISGAHVCL